MNSNDKVNTTGDYNLHLKPGDIGKYILLPGDPFRTDVVAAHFESPEVKAYNREFRTITGFYKGVRVSTVSTGAGSASAAIATHELIDLGAEVILRIGSTAAIQPGINRGDLLISAGVVRDEGTSKHYVPDGFPSVPDFELTLLLLDTCREMQEELGFAYHHGLNACDDAYYVEDESQRIARLAALGCLNIDMESSIVLNLCRLRGVRAAFIAAVSENLADDLGYLEKNDALKKGIEDEIQVALETIVSADTKFA